MWLVSGSLAYSWHKYRVADNKVLHTHSHYEDQAIGRLGKSISLNYGSEWWYWVLMFNKTTLLCNDQD